MFGPGRQVQACRGRSRLGWHESKVSLERVGEEPDPHDEGVSRAVRPMRPTVGASVPSPRSWGRATASERRVWTTTLIRYHSTPPGTYLRVWGVLPIDGKVGASQLALGWKPGERRIESRPAARENRTPDLLITNQPLFRLSYGGARRDSCQRGRSTFPPSHGPGGLDSFVERRRSRPCARGGRLSPLRRRGRESRRSTLGRL